MNDRRRGWSLALLLSSALLVVPLLVWFLLPNHDPRPPKKPRPRPSVAATTQPEATNIRSELPAPAPRPVDTKPNEDEPAEEGVAGSVVDADGQPVAKAFVGCDDRSSHITTSTDADGRFRLPIEADGCSVIAHHPEFPSSDRVRIQAGKDNVVRLGSGGTIEGVVVDEQGRPVASYRLSVEVFLPKTEGAELGPRGRPRQVNEESGAFRLERMPAGKYVLVASASGQPPGKSDSIDVDAGQTLRNVRIVLPRPATLTGTIRDEATRAPIAGAVVQLDGMAGGGGPNANPPATTDAQGNYSLTGVPPGPFSVRVDHSDYMSRTVAGLTTRGASSIREDIMLKPQGDGGPSSEMEGIGAMLAPSPSGIMIASVIESGPAANAGLKRGDRFVRIDGVSALEMTLSDAMQRLRGPEGSRVAITVAREDEGNVDVTVVRARIEY
ncbi:MAG: carboxypeptidase regulatory-like domain-containing protein [Polyangiaceae bacterium]|nr:carboxypeptidase regulatory-like domain-containing protein [Polyangiaceae bacterium]